MSLESLIEDSGQFCDISSEATPGTTPPLTTMGGVDRSQQWPTVAQAIPCLVRDRSATLNYNRNDARANVKTTRIYFLPYAIDFLISTRHRLTVYQGKDKTLQGVYAVQGAINPNSMDEILQVDCERIRTP